MPTTTSSRRRAGERPEIAVLKLMAVEDGAFCELKAEIRRDSSEEPWTQGRFSITGTEGEVVSADEAEERAIDYWDVFFSSEDDEFGRFAKQHSDVADVSTPRKAAEYVCEVDGVYHGLDVHDEVDGEVYLAEVVGCIHEKLEAWFPECRPFVKHHLNDSRPGCVHQEAIGFKRGLDFLVAFDESGTNAKWVLQAEGPIGAGDVSKEMESVVRARVMAKDQSNRNQIKKDMAFGLTYTKICREWFSIAHGETGEMHANVFEALDDFYRLRKSDETPKYKELHGELLDDFERALSWIEEDAARRHPDTSFSELIVTYEECANAPCPTCCYEYGTKHMKKPLPKELVEWVLGEAVE